ncbi:hypothetical protein NC652_004783 [Populus alba x Populus x berolinensis]|nr:hypothetical protein NC652_004783 [Populus alba x Populus x berolinensis]
MPRGRDFFDVRHLATKLKLREQKKGFEKQVRIRSNHFPVYVGDQELDEKLNRYDVPVACTSSIIFQALLRQFEDVLRRFVIHEVDRFPPLAL